MKHFPFTGEETWKQKRKELNEERKAEEKNMLEEMVARQASREEKLRTNVSIPKKNDVEYNQMAVKVLGP